MRVNTTPSNRVLPKYPLLIRHVTKASQRPVVGSALNWQGQSQLQLQLANSSPAIRHVICVGSPVFCCFMSPLLPIKGCHTQVGLRDDLMPAICCSGWSLGMVSQPVPGTASG